jgi:hypothetical protein
MLIVLIKIFLNSTRWEFSGCTRPSVNVYSIYVCSWNRRKSDRHAQPAYRFPFETLSRRVYCRSLFSAFSRPRTTLTLCYQKIINEDNAFETPRQFAISDIKLGLLLQTGSHITQFSLTKSAISEMFNTALGWVIFQYQVYVSVAIHISWFDVLH